MLGPSGLLPCSNTKLLTTPACTKQFPGSRHSVAPVLLGSGACAPSARAPHTAEYCVRPWLWHVCSMSQPPIPGHEMRHSCAYALHKPHSSQALPMGSYSMHTQQTTASKGHPAPAVSDGHTRVRQLAGGAPGGTRTGGHSWLVGAHPPTTEGLRQGPTRGLPRHT
jgi:hypothetical protein